MLVGLALAVVAALGGAALWTGTRGGGEPAGQVPAAPTAPAPVVTVSPADGAVDVGPAEAVRVRVSPGELTGVSLVSGADEPIAGALSADRRSWRSEAPLDYGRRYTLAVVSRDADGTAHRQTSTFTTVTPAEQTRVTFTATSGTPLVDGAGYGVGTVIVARFDEPVADRVAAEQLLTVRSDPPVEGSWYWLDDRRAHWRPPDYHRPGTRLVATASLFGRHLGDGLYGERDSRVAIRIGDARVSIADDATKQIEVYENGELVRTIATSMGMGGSQTVDGQTISFWTQPGVYTVMDKSPSVVMDSSSYGLPVDAPLGYKQTVHNAVRLTASGIYVHQLDSTVWAQGSTNVSHGCLNVNAGNAAWFYDFAQPGDVFEVRNTGGEPLPVWQNGDWGLPWPQWLAGSALR
ncbi:L,D-transpeptidase family protein [Mycolicibacillus parakoreensis]|nr:L,D-transpeptidase family protein [Mycolicibacillus parakoreensis]